MNVRTLSNAEQRSFEASFQAGKSAFEAGNRQQAHELWRKAATLDPYQEKVWIALLRVLETPDDRKVCLENILAINPTNAKYQRQLKQMQKAEKRAEDSPQLAPTKRTLFLCYVMQGIFLGIIGVLLGVCMSILVYGIR